MMQKRKSQTFWIFNLTRDYDGPQTWWWASCKLGPMTLQIAWRPGIKLSEVE